MERLWSRLAPRGQTSELAGVAVDAARPRRELVLENAVLHHQVNILRRRSKRPRLHLMGFDRQVRVGGATLVDRAERAPAVGKRTLTESLPVGEATRAERPIGWEKPVAGGVGGLLGALGVDQSSSADPGGSLLDEVDTGAVSHPLVRMGLVFNASRGTLINRTLGPNDRGIVPANDNANPAALIERRERLGGLLSYYYRAAA
jgi:hypothetical protein